MKDKELIESFLEIMRSGSSEELSMLKYETVNKVINGELDCAKSSLILNLAVQLRSVQLILEAATVVDRESLVEQLTESRDLEQEGLDEMLEDELDEMILGNVFMMDSYKNKGQDDTSED